MQALLLGTWGPQIAAYTQQYPRRVFAAVLVLVLLLDMLLRRAGYGFVASLLEMTNASTPLPLPSAARSEQSPAREAP